MIKKIFAIAISFLCLQLNFVYAMEHKEKKKEESNQHNAKYVQLAIMHAMVEIGANLDKEDEHGERPLHWAVYRKMPVLIKTLIESGADKNAKNKRGLTPLESFNYGPKVRTDQEEEFEKFYYPESKEAVLTALIATVSPQELSSVCLPIIVEEKMRLAKSWLSSDTNQDIFRQEILQSCDRILAKSNSISFK